MRLPVSLNGFLLLVIGAALLSFASAHAGVLPEDRADILGHVYDGGGVKVTGPSIILRKKITESFDASLTGDVDMVSSASIDVLTSASPYKERRTQWSAGMDYLRGKTTYSLSYLDSNEPDYKSNNASLNISEDMFGDLTTVTLGFSRGWDDIKARNKSAGTYDEKGKMDRRNYRVGLSQILTKNFIVGFNYESISQEGYLQNPYRSVRFCTNSACTAASTQAEIYPRTRTSNAFAIDGMYYLPYRASIKAAYRYYTDTWGIVGHTGELDYVHPIKTAWTVEAGVRYYTQTKADFYSDLFPFIDAQNFLARDKMLATFDDFAVHLGLSWRAQFNRRFSGVTSLFYDRIQYSYADFRNALEKNVAPTAQPLYSYGANVYMLQFSLRY